ncbi:uncharacterized protein LOC129232437 [Uloborus diversus]|uniref:uncharacterized protein LOC129232437 n=1 Tax=Uloborus diversus TaxID=327109 RepID=UPI002409986B|nr:uncharacterized protein LOC129232437 [Uloborus diversus]
MELVQTEEIIVEDRKCFYMPHHGVIREHSSTTKLRVVFDASAKSSTNISLNDVLHAGPKLQTDLFYILSNFRIHSIALAADIEKMFRQILVSHSDSDFRRIIWRENPDQKIEDYRLKTVTYGTACAPYLAIRTIKKLAEDEEMNFPKASKVIDKDFYVDDLLTGADSIQEAENLMSDLINLMRRGGFTLRKWISNEHSILSKLPPELKVTEQSINIAEDQSVKLLGIQWDPNQDTFAIHLNQAQDVTTKRQLLSSIARIYDPLGFISPSTVLAKIMMQKLWLCKSKWDDPLPDTMPESYQAENSLSYTSRFKLIQALREGFWRRWSAEYFTQLQQRSKWKSSNPNIKTGQLVLLKEDLKHPMKWSLGRVMETFPGDDGAVRVVQDNASAKH